MTEEVEEKKPQLFSNLQEIKRYDSDQFWFTKKGCVFGSLNGFLNFLLL